MTCRSRAFLRFRWGVTVAFKHACFVSYCHGDGLLMNSFVEQLVQALDSSLDAYLKQKVWLDRKRLRPGHLYNEAIARDLCESVVLVAVIVPRYFEQEYCRRELEAMRRIEAQRFARLGRAPGDRGLIVPILLRGRRDDLPEALRGHRHYGDFSAFTTASSRIVRCRAFNDQVEEIARFVFEMHRSLVAGGAEPGGDCDAFALPAAGEAQRWLVPVAPERLPFREHRP